MKKIYKLVLISIFLIFILIQFITYPRNEEEITSNHIFRQEQLSPEIKELLSNACINCHSAQTKYLWYHKVAPVSWLVNKDVNEGKEHLNFSLWGKMDAFDKIGALDEICDEVKDGKMPIKAYAIMHKGARLTAEQKDALCSWTEKLSEEILAKSNK